MIFLAKAGSPGDPISLNVVSHGTGISRRYLEQLAIPLKTAGLIRGVSGRHGGYVIARRVDDITVADMVSAASGPIDVSACAGSTGDCMRVEFCECRPLWILTNSALEKILGSFSLEDLIDDQRLAQLRKRADAVESGSAEVSVPWDSAKEFPAP